VKKRPDDADDDLFAQAMADVVPLDPDPRGRVRAIRHIGPPAPATRSARREAASVEPDDDAALEAAFVANGVDRRELRKLKRGDYPPGGRLDLHRRTVADAVAQVAHFIDRSRSRHRCVCIVHGRGLHSEGNVAVLKARVRQGLRQSVAVLAYADAPASDGGSGAVYVLLRK
jgi:DNA-nicking Smr family endonuclease